MILLTDLYTAYGELLVNKNTVITPEMLIRIREKGERHENVTVPLKNSELFRDFTDALKDERYKIIFEPPVTTKEISDIAGNLAIENDILFELGNMKKNLPYTYRHVLIVAAITIKMSVILKKNRYKASIVSHCGFTHDLGKTRIPISILEKEKALSGREIEIIKTHPIIGYLLLNYYLKSDRIECSLAGLEHHEKLDGSGYPKGLIRLTKYTQLVSPVDIMDALMTKRPYRHKGFSLRVSLDYLMREAGEGRINREVVATLISLARKNKPSIVSMKIAKEPREKLPEDLMHEKFM